jgi:hypothetical protein
VAISPTYGKSGLATPTATKLGQTGKHIGPKHSRKTVTSNTSPVAPSSTSPTAVPFNNNKHHPNTRCYNLHSHTHHISQSAIADALVLPDHHVTFAVIDKETGHALAYRDLIELEKY